MAEASRLIRWAGSKSKVSAEIRQYLSFDRDYIEPFCGSAVFFFDNAPESAYLNDLNRNLIDFLKDIKENYQEIWRIYNKFTVSEENYYIIRNIYNSIRRSKRKSAMFMFLNHFGFNGLYRTNKSGKFNTPYGAATKTKKKLELCDIEKFARKLQGVNLSSQDFEEFLIKVNPDGSCIYMDPPYFTEDSRVFGEYGSRIFSKADLCRLKKVAVTYSSRNLVVISYKDCSEFRDLFSEYIRSEISVIRNIGGFAGRRKSDQELIAVLGNA